MNANSKQKLLRVACHSAALCNWTLVILGVPLAVVLLSEDPLVRDSAKEALNFTITMFLLATVSIALIFTIIGIPAAVIGLVFFGVANTIFPLVAIVSVCINPDKPFRYPLTIRLIETDDPRRVQDASAN